MCACVCACVFCCVCACLCVCGGGVGVGVWMCVCRLRVHRVRGPGGGLRHHIVCGQIVGRLCSKALPPRQPPSSCPSTLRPRRVLAVLAMLFKCDWEMNEPFMTKDRCPEPPPGTKQSLGSTYVRKMVRTLLFPDSVRLMPAPLFLFTPPAPECLIVLIYAAGCCLLLCGRWWTSAVVTSRVRGGARTHWLMSVP